MNIIKIGGKYINVDNVTEFIDNEVNIRVSYNVSIVDDNGDMRPTVADYDIIEGAYAEILRDWLNTVSLDLEEIYQQRTEAQLRKQSS